MITSTKAKKDVPTAMKRAYRDAIALNNVAVRCAELGFHKQAVETFRLSVSLIQIAYAQQCDTEWFNSTSHSAMASDLPQSLAAVPSEPSTHFESRFFSSVSEDSDLSTGVDLVSGMDISTSKCHLIRFEVYSADGPTFREFDIDSAIILHNYGLACVCHSTVCRNMQTAFKLKRNGLKLIRWSQSLLCDRAARTCAIDRELADRILFLSLIVTKSMAHTHFIAGDDSRMVDECLAHLEHLRTTAHEQGLLSCLQVTIAAASAA